MNDQNNPFTSDFDNPVYVIRRLLRLFAITFFFMIFWKTIFSKKDKREREL